MQSTTYTYILLIQILLVHLVIQLTESKSNTPSSQARFVQIYETQCFDDRLEQWQAIITTTQQEQEQEQEQGYDDASSSSNVSSSSSEKEFLKRVSPPTGFEWSGDWKIDVQRGKRGQYGWEYFMAKKKDDNDKEDNVNMSTSMNKSKSLLSNKRRKRRWLRSIQPLVEETIDTDTILLAKKKRRDWKSLIRDQYNWKGFGFGFYKSLLWKYGAGIILKIPVALNFDFIERRPYLPNLSCGIGFFTCPWTLVGVFDFSFRVELIRFLLVRMIQELLFAFAGLLRLLRRHDEKILNRRNKLSYNNAVSERVGFSLSWRVKQGVSGTEFRMSPWVSYFSLLPTVSKALFGTETPVIVKNNEVLIKMTQWLDRRTAAIGMSSVRLPVDYNPQFTLSTYFHLNGFYYTPVFVYMKTYLRYLMHKSSSLRVEHILSNDDSLRTDKILSNSMNSIEIDSNSTAPGFAVKT